MCCFYSFTTTTFFFTIAITRYLSINAKCRAKIGSRSTTVGFLCLLICLLYIIAVAVSSVFYSEIYLGLTGVMMIATIVMYLMLYFEVRSYLVVTFDQPSSTMTSAQRGTILSLFYTTVISFLILLPCISTMFIWCWGAYSNWFWNANSNDCVSFIFINFFHHPVMAINFCCHPIIMFCTSRLLREECVVFMRKISLKFTGSGGYKYQKNEFDSASQNING